MTVLSSLNQFSDWSLLTLRLGVGTVFLVHGNQKRAMWKMQPSAQLPAGLLSLLRVLSIAEPLGGLATLVGLLTQAAAAGFILVMLGAIRDRKSTRLNSSHRCISYAVFCLKKKKKKKNTILSMLYA